MRVSLLSKLRRTKQPYEREGGGEGEELHSRTYTLKHKYTRIHAMLQFYSGLQ